MTHPRSNHLPGLLMVAVLALPADSRAQDADAMQLAEADAAADSAWSWFLDGQARYEHTEDIPNHPDLSRTRLRLRAGLIWSGDNGIELGAAVKGQVASSDNRLTIANNDNEQSDDARLDQAFLRWNYAENGQLLLGKAPLPLELSPLTWDADLRPIGASGRITLPSGDYSAWHFNFGYFAPDHLYDDDTRLAAVQLGYGWNEGAPRSAGALLSYLDFRDTEALIDAGLGRTNRRALVPAAGRILFISDYELLDLQLFGRVQLGDSADWPLEVRLDYVRNLGADDLDEGARGSVVLGDSRDGGWEFGFAYQRMQRDAVLAAYTEDDWWFHSFARGGMPWLGYGFDPHWRMRVAAFRERRDGIAKETDRVLLDVLTNW